jgi:Na+/melibiose symporter-like transporter
MIANPVAGALSDRTTGRFGRRHPWTVGGALAGAAALVLLVGQHTIAGVIIGWRLAQAGLNAMLASLTTGVPDHVPVAQRGVVSGWIGAAQTVSAVLAVALVTLVVTGNAGYVLIAALVVACALLFALTTPDVRLPVARPAAVRGAGVRQVLLAEPATVPRLRMDLANPLRSQYRQRHGRLLPAVLPAGQGSLQPPVPGPEGREWTAHSHRCLHGAVVITAVAGGVISDRTGRRKLPVTVAGLVMAVPAVMLALWPTWPVAVTSAALMGRGLGAYLSVDQALITQVLPSARTRAKDLGIINVANYGARVLAPAIAASLVSQFGGYPTLYLSVAAITVVGSAFVWKIRSVP